MVYIRHEADPKDIMMLEILEAREMPYCVVATKADKIPKTKVKGTIQQLAKGLGLEPEQIFPVSALKKTGVEKIYEWMRSLVIE